MFKYLSQPIVFIVKCVALILPFSSVVGYTEYALRNMPNVYTKKVELLKHRKSALQVIVGGTSHARDAYNPAAWSVEGLNIAASGQSLWYDKAIVERYVDSLPQLQLYIQNISLFSLAYAMKNYHVFYQDIWSVQQEKKNGWTLDNISYAYCYGWEVTKSAVYARFNHNLFAESINSSGWQEPPRGVSYDESEKEYKSHVEIMNADNVSYNSELLRNLIEGLKKRGIRTAIIITPMPEKYRNSASHNAMYQKAMDVLHDISIQHHVPLYNYAHDQRFAVAMADFTGASHMSSQGADKFSRIVNKEVIEPLLKKH